MKNKTKIIILIVVLLLIVLIPIGIASARGVFVQVKSDEEIAKANEEEYERALREKENFAKTSSENEATIKAEESNNSDIPNVDEKIAESKEKEEKLIGIIKRFYPEEFDAALNESKNEQDSGAVEISSSPLKNYQKTIYDLVLKILEEENLKEDEKDLLKEYVNSNMYNINKDENLSRRAKDVLGK